MATELNQDIARDFAAFKQGRKPPEKEEKAAASEPKGEKAEKPLASETSKTSETAGDSETPKSQEAQPKRHDADDRVRILTRRQKEMEEKHDKELRERDEKHERELAEIRKLLVTRVAAPTEQPQPKAEATPAPTVEADELDWDAFLAKAPKDEPLGKTIARYNREHFALLTAKERQKSQQTTAETARQNAIAKAREKHGAKVDAALGTKEDPTSGIALANGVIPFLAQYDNWVDVLVHLHDNPAEYRRIFAMPPQQQAGEVIYLARTLAATPAGEEQPPLEKPKPSAPPTSRIPAPMRVVGGTEASAPKTTADANSFGSFKKVSRYGNRRGA